MSTPDVFRTCPKCGRLLLGVWPHECSGVASDTSDHQPHNLVQSWRHGQLWGDCACGAAWTDSDVYGTVHDQYAAHVAALAAGRDGAVGWSVL